MKWIKLIRNLLRKPKKPRYTFSEAIAEGFKETLKELGY